MYNNCPRCGQSVDPQAINCPNCNNQLKAFGHPGIPLYRADDETWLCDRCTYHHDDTCNFPQRPYAKSCTLFHDYSEPLVAAVEPPVRKKGLELIKGWANRNRGLVALAMLIVVSILLASAKIFD